jgi:folate-dependent phosphoribosylglycinamide formyltransferase PurN
MSSRIVILASGDGSLAQSIIDACEGGKLPATIVAVISDRLRANVITRGKIAGIPTFVQVMAHDRPNLLIISRRLIHIRHSCRYFQVRMPFSIPCEQE